MATTNKAKQRIEVWFPALAKSGYAVTSKETIDYNCIAWAAGETHRRWDPAPGYYWPPGIPRDDRIENLVEVYRQLGFELCIGTVHEASVPERGTEKVALYTDGSEWTHAARQLENGKWTSKIGDMEDIEHMSPEDLAGTEYGSVTHILRRARTA